MLFSSINPITLLLICFSALFMLGLTLAARQRRNMRWHLILSWLVLIGILAVGHFCIEYVIYITKDEMRNNLSGLAKSFAIALQKAGHEKILADTPADDPIYRHTLGIMSTWQKKIDVAASIYTLRENAEGTPVFVCCPPADLNQDGQFSGKREELVPNGTLYEVENLADIPEIIDAFHGRSSFNNEPVRDEWGLWITATEPIPDEQSGEVDAVLGVDFWGEKWNAEIQQASLWPQLFLLSFLVLFFVVQVFLFNRQRIEDKLTEYAVDLERMVDELVVAKKNADAAILAKGYFLANMSHEIRTPMNAVLGCSDMLAEQEAGKTIALSRAELIDLIRKSSKDLMTVIDDILTFSNIDTNRVILEPVPVNVRQLVDDVKAMLKNRFDEKPQLTFRIDWDANVPKMIMGDPTRLRQILMNLLSNAVKFTEEGFIGVHCSVYYPSLAGEVGYSLYSGGQRASQSQVSSGMPVAALPYGSQVLRTRGLQGFSYSMTASINAADADRLRSLESVIAASPGQSVLQIDITDTGIGLSAEQIDRLFKPFSQADMTSTRKYGGTGLGLGIVKGLVQLMGGSVLVRSELGQGSTFSVLLPIKEPAASAVHLPPFAARAEQKNTVVGVPEKQLPLQNIRVLIVDDAIVNQLVAEAKLKNVGALVSTASDGQTAIEKIMSAENSDSPFDIVLMDLQMPIMDGLAATQKLRQLGFTKPIIALTANPDNGEASSAGCNLSLSKPVDRDVLISAVLKLTKK
jgi:signal transduction histidine kinase/ActR/RegA family two-component response regulator